MKKLSIIAILLALIFVLSACQGGQKAVTTGGKYMFVTGKSGGTYNSLGSAMATIVDKYLGSTTTVISTGGSFDNIDMLVKGDAQFAFCQSDILWYAMNGKEMYDENYKRGISVVATLYSEPVQVIVNADSEIETIGDLKGLTVAVGRYGTATEAAARLILQAYGISYDQITVRYQNFSEASSALASGTCDACFAVSCLPSGNVYEYSGIRPVKLLPISITNATKLKRNYPFFRDSMVGSEVYGCENSVSTLAIDVLLVCRSDVPADDVYSITSTLFSNIDELRSAHIRGSDIFVETSSETKVGAIHSGARDYYNSVDYSALSESAEEEPAPEEPVYEPEPETAEEPEETPSEPESEAA